MSSFETTLRHLQVHVSQLSLGRIPLSRTSKTHHGGRLAFENLHQENMLSVFLLVAPAQEASVTASVATSVAFQPEAKRDAQLRPLYIVSLKVNR